MTKARQKQKKKHKAQPKSADGRASHEAETGTPVVGRYRAQVFVSLKPTVNDPEGNTIAGALTSLGFGGVEGVRSGRYFQLTLHAENRKAAAGQVEQMCARLLANPVIETYTFAIDRA